MAPEVREVEGIPGDLEETKCEICSPRELTNLL